MKPLHKDDEYIVKYYNDYEIVCSESRDEDMHRDYIRKVVNSKHVTRGDNIDKRKIK